MIGILDSGVGGLSVLREMRRCMPGCNFIYYGDTARGPYGQRSPETVESYVLQGLSRLADMGAGLLVVAGHSAAACLTDDAGKRFSVPVFDIITTGVVPGLSLLMPKAIGILGPTLLETAGTHEQAIRRALPGVHIYSVSAPLLEPLIEDGWLEKPETVMIVKKYLHFLKLRQVDTLVLGSNHYTHLIRVIQRKIGKRVTLSDAAPTLAQGVKDFLAAHPRLGDPCGNNGACRVLVSEVTNRLEKTARMFYGGNVLLERL